MLMSGFHKVATYAVCSVLIFCLFRGVGDDEWLVTEHLLLASCASGQGQETVETKRGLQLVFRFHFGFIVFVAQPREKKRFEKFPYIFLGWPLGKRERERDVLRQR